MLRMLIKKPTHVTIVMALPFTSEAELLATDVENKGESATTTNPQSNRKRMMTQSLAYKNTKGESRQHKKEIKRKEKAVRCTPKFLEIYPATIQPSAPIAIIEKERRE